jgi:hypothetical protein
MGGLSIKLILHFLENQMKLLEIKFTVEPVEDLDKTTHMGPFEAVRQVHIHVHCGHCMLQVLLPVQYSNRVRNSLYADLSNTDSAIILKVLNIFHYRGRPPKRQS